MNKDARISAQAVSLDNVAAQIRPLPANVVPSSAFLAQMRLRLLQLPEAVSQQRAA